MHRTSRYLIVTILLLAILSSAAFAAKEGMVYETVLPNGLKVLTKEIHAAPVFTLQVWYKVGSRNEHTGITGVSHLLEHMMFKGTKNYGKGEMTRLVRERGGIDNAATWVDYTYYWELLSSEHLELAMKLEADRMKNALIDPKEFKAEMVVVRSELEGRENDPGSLLYNEVTAQAIQAHPYHHPVIGWRSDVENMTRDDLYEYYRTYYHPNNATLVLVGDFNTETAMPLIKKYFGAIPKGPQPPKVNTVEPPQRGERRTTIRREGTAERVMIAYHIPAISHPDTYALSVLDQVLSGGRSSRFYQALVEKGLATSAWSSASSRKDPGLFFVGGTARNGVKAQEIEKALLEQIELVKNQPITDQELQQAKNQIESYFVFSNDSVSDQAEQLGQFETMATWKLVDQYVPAIKKVTKEDVQRVAKTYLTEDNRTVGYFLPTGPPSGGVEAPPPGAVHHKPLAALPAYYRPRSDYSPDKVLAQNKTAPKPAPKPAAAAVSEPKVKPTRVVLPNGITLIVQENHSNRTVAVRGNLKAGSFFDPKGKEGTSSLTAGMLNRGTQKRTALQIAQETEFVGASVSVNAGVESAGFTASALSKDFDLVMDVLSDILRNPTFPQDQFDKLKGQTLSRLEQEKEDPESRAYRRFRAVLYPEGHPYHQKTIEQSIETINSITREDLVNFYSSYYAPDSMIIVIVGDVTASQAKAAVEKYFGDWPKKGTPTKIEIPDVPVQAKPVREVIQMMDKSQVEVIYGHVGGLKRSDPDYYAANVMNQVLGGGGALASRLGKTIREDMGLVYSVYSTFSATLGEGPWYASLGTNPNNVDKAVKALQAEVEKMRQNGATKEEFAEAKQFIIGVFPIALETNSGVAGTLLNAEFYGLGMNYIRDYAKIYRAVTLEQVNAAAKKYLHPDKATLIIAGPYKGQQEAQK